MKWHIEKCVSGVAKRMWKYPHRFAMSYVTHCRWSCCCLKEKRVCCKRKKVCHCQCQCQTSVDEDENYFRLLLTRLWWLLHYCSYCPSTTSNFTITSFYDWRTVAAVSLTPGIDYNLPYAILEVSDDHSSILSFLRFNPSNYTIQTTTTTKSISFFFYLSFCQQLGTLNW